MYLLHPTALWLSLGAAIPVLLHLLARARPRSLVFPGAYLLRQMEARRRSLRFSHLLLLALRVLTILLLAASCTAPRLRLALPLLAHRPSQVLIVDTSASLNRDPAAWQVVVQIAERLRADDHAARAALLTEPTLTSVDLAPANLLAASGPGWGQGALAERARQAAADLSADDAQAHLVVLTDLDASSLLPRRWPPSQLPADVTIVDCRGTDQLGRSVYTASLVPPDPPAGAPARLDLYVAGRGKSVVRAEAGLGLVGSTELADGQRMVSVSLGKLPPGEREVKVSTGRDTSWRLAAHVRTSVPVLLLAREPARSYLAAALDPLGLERPFSLVTNPRDAQLVVAVPADGMSVPGETAPGTCVVLFAGGEGDLGSWFAPLLGRTLAELHADSPRRLTQETAERLTRVVDAPPLALPLLADLGAALEDTRVLQPVPLRATGAWKTLARFSDGRPAMVLAESLRGLALCFGFAPEPASTDLVTGGAFPALLHALLPRLVGPATPHPEQLPVGANAWKLTLGGSVPTEPELVAVAQGGTAAANPPPAEMGAERLSGEQVRRLWGLRTEVVAAESLQESLPPVRTSDLTPLAVLLLLAAMGVEWLLGASLSAPPED